MEKKYFIRWFEDGLFQRTSRKYLMTWKDANNLLHLYPNGVIMEEI